MASSGSSSADFYGITEDQILQTNLPATAETTTAATAPMILHPIHSSAAATPASTAQTTVKKRRNLPGTTAPDAEVIALSPGTLLATNRFICEVCNKGFQREQNLQLHRRGHNLPWKLRQKSTKEVRRKMYLCPEPTCIHHDPSRALGDLTGIKKHFCRKHGEKKWKCEKCSKRYAVQSDLKAHSKTCGTREYRCDCGTLFSRRDSFITHRAFCDALAQESARLPTGLTTLGNHFYGTNNIPFTFSQLNSHLKSLQDHQTQPSSNLLRLGGNNVRSQFDHLIAQQNKSAMAFSGPPSSFYLGTGTSNQEFSEDTQSHHNFFESKPNFHALMQLPDLHSNAGPAGSSPTSSVTAANLFSLNFFSNASNASDMSNNNNAVDHNQNNQLLMTDQYNNANSSGSTEANTLFSNTLMSDDHQIVDTLYSSSAIQNESLQLPQMSATALLQKATQIGSKAALDFHPDQSGFRSAQMESDIQLQNLMNSLANGSSPGILFGGRGHDQNNNNSNNNTLCFNAFNSGLLDGSKFGVSSNVNLSVSDRLTRDFLGVGNNMALRSINGGAISEQQHQHQHLGIELTSFDSEFKKAQANGRPFASNML